MDKTENRGEKIKSLGAVYSPLYDFYVYKNKYNGKSETITSETLNTLEEEVFEILCTTIGIFNN